MIGETCTFHMFSAIKNTGHLTLTFLGTLGQISNQEKGRYS